MNVEILVAVIAAVASIVGVVIASITTNRQANKEVMSKLDKSLTDLDKAQALTNQRIDELTREVHTHNEFASRVPVVENRVGTLEREMGEVRGLIGMKGSDKHERQTDQP